MLEPNDPIALDAPCGRALRFRDLVECGQTWKRLAREGAEVGFNAPQQRATFSAVVRLCRDVLDPVVETFGPIELTYGFSSRALHRHIARDIAPDLDQHAGYELNSRGKPICKRLGIAVDFFIPGRDSLEIARWIAANTAFDRLYIYGSDRPLHVSVGPDESRSITIVARSSTGRRYPKRTMPAARWLAIDIV